MPTYEYACRGCGEHLEIVQSFKDEPLTECPNCGGELRKVFGAIGIAFKGSGFYRNDSRPEPKESKESKAPKKANDASDSGSKEKADSTSGSSGSSGSSGDGSSAKSADKSAKGDKSDSKSAASS